VIFHDTRLAGAVMVEPTRLVDARGFFARLIDADLFARRGMTTHLEQASISFNARAGTIRGIHLQRPPHAEAKLVRVTAGAIFDVIVDLRGGSPTFGQWEGFELSAASRRQLYIPPGVGHGFQTLTDDVEITYNIATGHAPEAQDGVVWNDADLGVEWPDPAGAILSERDRHLPSLRAFRPVVGLSQ
jgi:dTDP-4-dehydrorhamnose 3,5-epimerase